MNVTGQVWMTLTVGERMAVLQFAANENKKRWEMKKAALAEATR